jgi:hypothetical protein
MPANNDLAAYSKTMNPTFLSTILLVLLPAYILGQEADSKSALTSFLGFLKEAKQEEAVAVTFSKPGETTAAAERVKKLIAQSKAHQDSPLEVVESKEVGTVARVIIKDSVKRPDGKPDYDGILLVKREGVWKIVLNANEFEDDPGLTDANERKALAELRDWENKQIQIMTSEAKP